MKVMKIKDLICNSWILMQRLAETSVLLDDNKKQIQKFFDTKGIDTYTVETENISLMATKEKRVTINYDIEKLSENLDKEVLNEIITKEYYVVDMDRLKKLLKEAGVSPKEFKQCISVNQKVNKKALNQLYNVGDITKEQLKGCYDATIIKSIKIKDISKKG